MLPELRDLQLFVACCRQGSMSAAARAAGLTPNAVSQAIKRLEGQLGARLFDRTTRSMRLTADGSAFLDRVAPAVAEIGLAVRDVDAAREELAGPIRLAAPSDLARGRLASALDAFVAAHPRVLVELVVDDRVVDLVEQRLDVAVRYGTLPDSSLVARRILAEHRIVVASPSYLSLRGTPARPEDLADHDALGWLSGGGPRRRWTFTRADETVRVEVTVTRAANDGEILRGWAVRGFGIAWKNPLDVEGDLLAHRLVHLLPDWLGEPSPLYVVLPGGGRRTARVRKLVEHLTTALSASVRPSTRTST